MTDLSLTLEKRKFSSPKERIRLLITSSARFRCDDEQVRCLSSSQLVESLQTGKISVTRGPGCKLDFSIVLRKLHLQEMSEKALAEQLGQAVCQAPWWAQLPISPSVECVSESSLGQDPGAGFSFKIGDTLPDLSVDELGKSNSPSAEDFHIPDAVTQVKLLAITVVLTFEHIPESSSLAPAKPCATNDEMLLEESVNEDDDIIDLDDLDFHLSQREAPFSSSFTLEPESPPSLFFEDEPGDASTPSLTQASTPFLSQESLQNCQPLQSSHCDFEDFHYLDITTARTLTDVACRTLIGGRPTKHVSSVRFGKPRPTYSLSCIMPLLWSPGFQSTMKQRSQFLDTISNTVTHLTQTAQSPSLQQKLAFIQAMGSATEPSSLSSIVQGKLFRMMHATSYDPMSARRLRHAKINAEDEDAGKEEETDEMIIDTPSQHVVEECLRDETHFGAGAETEFEDMFEEELLSDDEIDMLFDLEIMRQQPKRNTRGSCSMLLQSEADCSMLLESEAGSLEVEPMDEIMEERRTWHWQHEMKAEEEMSMNDVPPPMLDQSSLYTVNEGMLI